MAEEADIRQQTAEVLKSHPRERGRLISMLQAIQARFGYLPRESMLEASRFLDIADSEVYSVATFYNQFRFTPPGRHQIKVCLGTACQIKGGQMVLESWERETGIDEGQTTADGEFSLERVACVGCCAMAPVAVVNEQVEGRVTPTRVKGVLLAVRLEREKDEEGRD